MEREGWFTRAWH